MALPDTRAFHDPFIARINQFFQVIVCHDFFRDIGTHPQKTHTDS